jgi:magnesium transporter
METGEMNLSESGFYFIPENAELVRIDNLGDALAKPRKDGFLWLNFCQPTKEELSTLIEPLDLHPLSVEDCLDDNQIPKIEDYPKHTFILFNAFDYSNKVLSIDEVDIFIGKDFLVTVSRCAEDHPNPLKGIERLLELDTENTHQGPAFLAHVILDYIVDQKFLAIETLEEQLNDAEDTILADHANFNPGVLIHLRRELLSLRKSLFHEREILVKICRKDCLYIPEKALFYYRDIYDHLTRFFELTESSRDIVTSLMEMYLSILNNQMTKSSNDTNLTVRRLTFITTIFMPLTLLAGIGGMSEWSMMTGPENWRIAYPLFLLGMAILGFISYQFLKLLEKRNNKLDGVQK